MERDGFAATAFVARRLGVCHKGVCLVGYELSQFCTSCLSFKLIALVSKEKKTSTKFGRKVTEEEEKTERSIQRRQRNQPRCRCTARHNFYGEGAV